MLLSLVRELLLNGCKVPRLTVGRRDEHHLTWCQG